MDAFDEDVPAGLRDADLEMAGLEAQARRASALRKRGICTHGWISCEDGRTILCQECKVRFVGKDAWLSARREALR